MSDQKTYELGGGPHAAEVRLLRRELGAHALALVVIDEQGSIHVTAQTEPTAFGVLLQAGEHLETLLAALRELALRRESWTLELQSPARLAKPPCGLDGVAYPPGMLDEFPPHIVAASAVRLTPKLPRRTT